MSCSKALLSKKGAMGVVWVAAVSGVAALRRDQIAGTDVAASVDKILTDVETTYRILGLLLLGIVRLYSKKVEYVWHECNEIVSLESMHCTELSISTRGARHRVSKQVKKSVHPRILVVGKQDINKVKKSTRAARTTIVSSMISSKNLSSRIETGATSQTSAEVREAHVTAALPIFTIPTRFELDSFDLGISEDRDEEEDRHQLPRQDTLQEDGNHHTSYLSESYKRVTYSYADLDSACIMPVRITIPTEMISAIREVDSLLYFSGIGDEPERDSRNSDFACFTPLKDVLPPEMVAEVNDPSDKSRRGKNPQRELNRDDNGDSSCYIPLPESQVGQNIAENVIPNVNANCHTVEEPEDGLLQGINTDPTVQFPCNDMEEHEPFELPTLRCKTKLINEMSPSTSEPMTEAATGVLCSPKFMVTTPAKNEKHQVTRKRRRVYNKDYIPRDRGDKRQVRRRGAPALYDENIVLPNEILRKAIEDTSDLVLRRGKAPHTCLDTWKEARLGSLPATFMDPLILYSTSVYLKYTVTTDAPKSSCGESVKTRRHLSFDLSETNNICNDAKNVEGESIPEPRKRKLDELTNGIQVPVGLCIESGQFQDDDCRFNVDTAIEKGLPLSINGHGSHSAGLLERLHESKSNGLKRHESLSAAIDNLDEVIPMDEGHARDECLLSSTRTRTVARYFHQLLEDHKCQQGNNSVRLGQVLQGRKRETSARFFYETLVLKSHGLIEVNQEQPYEEIIVSATRQLEAELLRQSKAII